jgi:hypothetical protein
LTWDGGESPVDTDNHALAALRYLITSLDSHRMLQRKGKHSATPKTPEQLKEEQEREEARKYWEYMRSEDPRIWRRLW